MKCEMSPYKMADYECVKNHTGKFAGGVMLAGITALVIALLGMTGIINLHPQINFGLGLAGTAFVVSAGIVLASAIPDDATAQKVAILAVQLIAMAAIVCGALGLSGHLAFLRGTTGALVAGAGAVLMTVNYVPYCFKYPLQVVTG